MKQITLGNTQEKISAMCLGTMYFGSRVSEETSFELMDHYYESGGRFLDTSNNYCFWIDGYTGDESEITLGRWLKSRKNRKDIFLATKCGVRPLKSSAGDELEFEGLSREAIFKAVEDSLERLQTDYIDLYYIHVDWRDVALEETLGALNDLVQSGKVRHIACSNMSTWRLAMAKDISRRNQWPEFVGIQNWYSYLKPRENADLWVQKFVNEELLDYCRTEKDTTIFAYTSTLAGMYNWDTIYDKNHPALNNRFFSEDNERRFMAVKEIAEAHGVSPFQIVFSWMMKHNADIVPIIGVSSLKQLKDNLASLNLNLSDSEFEKMNLAPFNQMDYIDKEEVSLI